MKNTKTIMREAKQHHQADEYEFYANAERTGEISRNVYYQACQNAGLKKSEAASCLRENYQRAGLAHLFQ